MNEQWKSIPGYGGRYSVSDRGRVRNNWATRSHPPGYILKHIALNTGYVMVNLYQFRKTQTRTIHSLVAEAFLGNRPAGFEVNHKDGDKQHNVLANLEYVTVKENALHKYRVLGVLAVRGSKNGQSTLTEDDVRIIRRLAGRRNHTALGRRFGVWGTTIRDIVRRVTWKHVI